MYVYMLHHCVSPFTPATLPNRRNNAAGKGQNSKVGMKMNLMNEKHLILSPSVVPSDIFRECFCFSFLSLFSLTGCHCPFYTPYLSP